MLARSEVSRGAVTVRVASYRQQELCVKYTPRTRSPPGVGFVAAIAIGNRAEFAPVLMESMHQFRREVFVQRLGWSLPLLEGHERDQYDRDDTVYFLAVDSQECVTACARLLPTTGAYMLPELFPQLLGGISAPSHPTIWELSRFAADVRMTREGRVLSLSRPTLELLSSVLSFARGHEIEYLVLVTSIAIERLLLRTRFDVHRVAAPERVNGAACVALLINTLVEPE
jgi:acyl homoserine lactone synthase